MLKKSLLLTAAFIFCLASINFAQGMGRMTPEERTKQLVEQLKLDKEQTKKVEDIFKKQQEKMQKIFESGGGFGDPGTRDKMMKMREETNGEIMKLLTDKQKPVYKKILDEQKKRMEERMKERGN